METTGQMRLVTSVQRSISLPVDLDEALEQAKEATAIPRSVIIQHALAEYFERQYENR